MLSLKTYRNRRCVNVVCYKGCVKSVSLKVCHYHFLWEEGIQDKIQVNSRNNLHKIDTSIITGFIVGPPTSVSIYSISED